jgi:hypothetical protein
MTWCHGVTAAINTKFWSVAFVLTYPSIFTIMYSIMEVKHKSNSQKVLCLKNEKYYYRYAFRIYYAHNSLNPNLLFLCRLVLQVDKEFSEKKVVFFFRIEILGTLSTFKINAACSSKTMVSIHKTTRHLNPKDYTQN